MAVTAAIVFTQGLVVGGAGEALIGAKAVPVTVSNANNAGVTAWTFEVLDVPPGSAVAVGVVQSGPGSTWTFTPDLAGSYLVQLTVTGTGNATDAHAFMAKMKSGRLIPPFTKPGLLGHKVVNYGAQGRGWAPFMEPHLHGLENETVGRLPYGTPDADFTITDDDWALRTIEFTGTLTGPHLATTPKTDGSVRILVNKTTHTLQFKATGGSNIVTVVPGSTALVRCDGTELYSVISLVSGSATTSTMSGSGAAGDVVCNAGDATDPAKLTKALPTALRAAGIAAGFALSGWANGDSIQIAGPGTRVNASLGTPSSGKNTPVAVDSAAHAVLKPLLAPEDFAIGVADGTKGYVTVTPATPTTEDIDPALFGAVYDGATDAYAALARALASVPVNGGRFKLGRGTLLLSRPLRIAADFVKIAGAHSGASRVIGDPTTYVGPVFVVAPAMTPLALGANLLAGSPSTKSFSMSATSPIEYLNLRDCHALELGGQDGITGLAAFAVEFPYKHGANVSSGQGTCTILSSSGRHLASVTNPYVACAVQVLYSGGATDHLRAILTTDGGGETTHTITANNVVPVGTKIDVAVTYDGATLRLFVNGSVVASTAATGLTFQHSVEDFLIGGQVDIWPERTFLHTQPTGLLGPVRFSKVARHTGTYTPSTSTFAVDTDTLLYVGWDNQQGDAFTVGTTGITSPALPVWLSLRKLSFVDVLAGFQLRDLWFDAPDGAAIILHGTDGVDVEDVHVDHCRDGMLVLATAVRSTFARLDFTGGVHGRYGILNNAGVADFTQPTFDAFRYGLVSSATTSVGAIVATGANLRVGGFFQGAGSSTPVDVSLKAPVSVTAPSAAGFVFSSCLSHTLDSPNIDSTAAVSVPLLFDCRPAGDSIVHAKNVVIGAHPSMTECVTFSGTNPKSFELVGHKIYGPGGGASTVPITTAPNVPLVVEPENALGSQSVTMADADIVLTTQQYLSKTITLEESTPLTDWRHVTLPTWASPVRHVYNHTSKPILVKTASGRGVPVHPQRNAIVRCDGTDVVRAGAADTFYNVVEFGAVGDASLSSHDGTDDTAAIQRTIDIATAAGGGTVFFPVGVYKILKPLKIDAQFVVLQGENTNAILSFIDSWGINIFLAAGSTGQFDASTKFGTSLYASDSRPAIRLGHFVDIAPTGPVQYIVNLSHVPGGSQFDGLTAICFEFRMKINSVPFDADPNTPWYFLTSAGARSINDPDIHQLFGLALTEDLKIRADLRPITEAGGTSFSSPLSLGTTYDVKINYDSATDGVIRIYINGVLDIPSVGVTTGALTQRPHEEVFLGGSQGTFPGGFGSAPPDMWIDSLRISDISREVGAYTPSATKLLEDGNTMFLLNQEERNDFLFRGRSRSKRISPPVTQFSDTWFTIETSNRTDERHNNGVKDLTIRSYGGSAIYMTGQLGWFIEHVRLMECWEGIYAHDNCYNGSIHRVWGTAGFYGGRFGVCYLAALATIQDCEFHFRYGVAVGGTADIINCYFNTDDPVIAIYCGAFADSVLVRGCGLSDENFGPLFATQIYVAGARTVIVEGTSLECGNSTKANVIVDGADQENTPLTECLELNGCIFKYQAGTAENVQMISPTKNPVLVRDKRGIINTGSFVEIPVTTSRTCAVIVEPRHASGRKVLDFPSDANLSLTADAWSYHWIKFTDIAHTLSAPRNVSVPKFEGWTRVVENATTRDLTLKTDAGTGIVVPVGQRRLLGCDGTNIVDVLAGIAGVSLWDQATANFFGGSALPSLLPHDASVRAVGWRKAAVNPNITIEDQTGDTNTTALSVQGQFASATATGGNKVGGSLSLLSGGGTTADGTDDGTLDVGTYNGAKHTFSPNSGSARHSNLSKVDKAQWSNIAGTVNVGDEIYTATTFTTTADTVIATIPLADDGTPTTHLVLVEIFAEKGAGAGSPQGGHAFVTQLYVWDGAALVEQGTANGDVSGAHGQAFTPKLVVSSTNALVKVTPWSATSTKWTVTVQRKRRT